MKTIRTPAMRSSILCLLASAFCLLAPQAPAAETYWGGGTGAITDNNWYSDTALTTLVTRANGDVINLFSGTLYIDGNATVYDTNIGMNAGDSAAVIVNGTWNNTAGELSIGNGLDSFGSLSILSGSVRASTFYAGNYGSGTFYLAPSATLTNSANAFLGRNVATGATANDFAVIDGVWNVGGNFTAAYSQNHHGEITINGVLNVTGATSLFSVGYAGETEAAAGAAIGIMRITPSGTVIASGTESTLGHLGMASGTNYINNASGTAFVEGVWKNAGNLIVGRSGAGWLEILAGGTVTVGTFSYFGNGNSVSNAKYAATGPIGGVGFVNGYFGISDYLYVGGNAPGYLEIGTTGYVTTTTGILSIGHVAVSSGTVIVDGGFLGVGNYGYVGNAGPGYLEIRSSGTVVTGLATPTTNGYIHVGRSAAGSGTVKVVDGLFDIHGSFQVGYGGRGYFEIGTSGTTIIRTYTAIGATNNSFGTIDVAGLFTGTTHLYLGRNPTVSVTSSGTGILNILNTGTVALGGNLIAAAIENSGQTTSAGVTSTGTASVAGLLYVAGNAIFGQRGDAYLDIQPGGSVIVGGTTIFGDTATGVGTLILNGGLLETRQIVVGAGVAAILLNGGTLRAGANTDNFVANIPVFNLGSSTLPIDTQSYVVTATNALAGTAAATLNKLGAGVLLLTADSSGYAGTTNVLAGSLGGGSASAKLGGTINIHAGAALDLRYAPLTTTGDLVFDNYARWRYSMTGNHVLESLGSINFNGPGTFVLDMGDYSVTDIIGSRVVANYNTITGAPNLDFWAVAAPGLIFDATLDITTNPGSITLNIVEGSIYILHWNGGNGNWDASTAWWKRSGTGGDLLWFDTAYAVFATGSGIVDVVGTQEVTGIEFNVNGYTLAGTGTLVSDENLNINTYTTSATATINTAINVNAGFSKTGAGTLILGGTSKFAGAAIVDMGTIEIAPAGFLTAATGSVGTNPGYTAGFDVAGRMQIDGNFIVGAGGDGVVNVASTGFVGVVGTTYIGYADGATGYVTLDGGVWNNSGNFSVGQASGATGFLTIDSGTLTIQGVNGTYIGNQAGSQGAVTIKNGGYWNNTTTVYVGSAGSGNLTIEAGGTVRFGTVSYLGNADTAFGSLTIKDGGYLSTGGRIYISNNGGTGFLNIEEGAYLRAGTGIMVGYNGFGELNVAPSGTLILDGQCLYIGGDAGINTTAYGVANINGFYQSAPGVIDGVTTGTYYQPVGYSGTGIMNIGVSGTVIAGQIDIGREATATGYVTVEGLYKSTVTNDNRIGANGKGTLVIKNGGFFDASTGGFIVGAAAGGVGEMSIEAGGRLSTATGIISNNATALGSASVAGLWQNSGTFTLGAANVGVLNITPTGTVSAGARYIQSARGVLNVEVNLARTTPYISVSGPARLAGTLNVFGLPAVGQYARASDIQPFSSSLIMRASGGFSGNFDGGGSVGVSTPSYIGLGGFVENGTDYRVGYKLIGVFDLAEGETFDLDIPLVTQPAALGWNGNSLTKSGPGTLIVSAPTNYTGATRVNGGVLQYATPDNVILRGPLDIYNHGIVDFNSATTDTGHRLIAATRLNGEGGLLMTINPTAHTNDLLLINGDATGAFDIMFDIVGGMSYEIEPMTLVVVTDRNSASFDGGFDAGPRNYSVKKLDDGTVVLSLDGLSLASESILGMATSQNMLWSGQRANLGRRFGELRLPGLKESRGGLWARGFTERVTVDADDERRGYNGDLFGLTVGADIERAVTEGTRNFAGIFAGTGYARQNFRSLRDLGTGDGTSTMVTGGLYVARLLDTGWYLDLAAVYMNFKNKFNVTDRSHKITTGKNDGEAMNFSFETGRRLSLKNGWFVEPSVQGSYTYIWGSTYQTTGAIRDVSVSLTGVWQGRAGLQFGRASTLANGNTLQIHGRIYGVYEFSNGGEIQIEDVTRRPNLDGAAVEAGAGLAWRMSPVDHVFFDYEAAYGQNYKKPWSFSLGFRHNF